MSSVTGNRGLQPVHHHAERIADQDDVAMLVEDARRMGMIGREHHDRLAALAGADVGRREPLWCRVGRHGGQVPKAGRSEHRQPDHQRMEDEAEREIENRPDDDGGDVVPASADRDRRCARVAAALER